MNPTLLAREAAATLGALDPRPEPPQLFAGPCRLHRLVEAEKEIWLDPTTGREIHENDDE